VLARERVRSGSGEDLEPFLTEDLFATAIPAV